MITKYFTKVVVKFNPLGKEKGFINLYSTKGKPARLFLAAIPPSLKGQCSIDNEVLTSTSKNKPVVKVTYKDKQTLEADPTAASFNELAAYFDRHSRQLQIKESIES